MYFVLYSPPRGRDVRAPAPTAYGNGRPVVISGLTGAARARYRRTPTSRARAEWRLHRAGTFLIGREGPAAAGQQPLTLWIPRTVPVTCRGPGVEVWCALVGGEELVWLLSSTEGGLAVPTGTGAHLAGGIKWTHSAGRRGSG